MSTRCMIGKLEKDVIKAIYCHFDGYIKGGVGELLKEYYSTKDKLDTLLSLGDISYLGSEPKSSHEFWEMTEKNSEIYLGKVNNFCLAYKDRFIIPNSWKDKPDYSASEFKTRRSYVDSAYRRGAEFIYLFDVTKSTWKVCSSGYSFRDF